MSQTPGENELRIAANFQRQGRLADAERIYRQILERSPNQVDAMHMLGVIAAQLRRPAEAVERFRRTVALKPDFSIAHYHLGNALHETGQYEEAAAAYSRALELNPESIEALVNLGRTNLQRGYFDQAIDVYRRALKLKPDLQIAHLNLANALREAGKTEEAVVAYRRAMMLEPRSANAALGLARALNDQGQLDEAIFLFRKAVELNPKNPFAFLYLGAALFSRGWIDQAIAAYRRAVEIGPSDAQSRGHLGVALLKKGDVDEAIACFEKALQLNPNLAQVHTNISAAYKERGQLDAAIAACRRAIELKPDNPRAHSNLILLEHYHPNFTAEMLLEEAKRWATRYEEPILNQRKSLANDRSPGRKLKIGYVSGDINVHPVGRFLLPLLQHHDHGGFEIHCFSDTQATDRFTDEAHRLSDGWHETAGFSDDALAEEVRKNGIDILVDLSLHSANRLQVFARKPAPIQVTWLGYPGTTGLRSMDYRLSDRFIDPPGEIENDYVEETIRIESYWCYQPFGASGEVGPLPAATAGQITFGCLNNFCKMSSTALEIWARILEQVPDSRLMLASNPGIQQQWMKDWFSARNIDPVRIEFMNRRPIEEYFKQYDKIDIALDTTPFAGGTTTADALWMGVPVITLAGKTAVGRSGVSLLSNVGLPELIAKSAEGYVKIAVELSSDVGKLAALRNGLRERMLGSTLMNAGRFSAGMESAYRAMWARYCSRSR